MMSILSAIVVILMTCLTAAQTDRQEAARADYRRTGAGTNSNSNRMLDYSVGLSGQLNNNAIT